MSAFRKIISILVVCSVFTSAVKAYWFFYEKQASPDEDVGDVNDDSNENSKEDSNDEDSNDEDSDDEDSDDEDSDDEDSNDEDFDDEDSDDEDFENEDFEDEDSDDASGNKFNRNSKKLNIGRTRKYLNVGFIRKSDESSDEKFDYNSGTHLRKYITKRSRAGEHVNEGACSDSSKESTEYISDVNPNEKL
ncbi:hypothetical protein HELRODRAFT_159099 [Helobdella robusta]|uniref:Uncharacterized protein n=1 Tax=Helobdella robusta TaxID=6412 RepID=T1ENL1_HELRO|nr:hypothetical protein HELRODRAFT_159099 [Helobdella robusta]ESO12541.1 hypothetical protein HELRODRAFT_159099 [Helobdella robusta]